MFGEGMTQKSEFQDTGFRQTKTRRNSIGATDNELAEEIEELLAQEALSKADASGLLQRYRNSNPRSKGNTSTSAHSIAKVAALSGDGIPSNWSRDMSRHAVYTLIELKRGEREFDEIESDLTAAGIKVLQIERLQNVRLLDRFKAEIKDVENHRSKGFDVNICYLYHGTNGEKERLCEESLDQRLSRMGHYGRGIYFSDNPAKCVQYTKRSDDSSTTPYILRCRVILGDTKVYPNGKYDTSLCREPEKENHVSGWRYYDSVMGRPVDYSEYVVYESRRAMIEYIITFSSESKTALGQTDSITKSYEISYNSASADIKDDLEKASEDYEEASDLEKASEDFEEALYLEKASEALEEASEDLGKASEDFEESSEDLDEISDNDESACDDHFQRITEVREAVRRKRRTEEGLDYHPPSEEQTQRDNELWERLQELHCGESVKKSNKNSTLYGNAVAEESDSTWNEDIRSPVHGQFDSRTRGYRNASRNPVAQVLSLNISEFMQVTDVDDSSIARQYLKRANMDVNLAIQYYYEEM